MRSGAELPLLSKSESLAQAIMKMNRTPGRPGAVLITDAEGRLVGIFTHGDLARLMEGDAPLDKRAPVERLMRTHPKSIGPEQLVEDATRRMKEHREDQIAV